MLRYKAVFMLIISCFLLLSFTIPAVAVQADSLQELSVELPLSYIDTYINDLDNEFAGYMDSFSLKALWGDLRSGKMSFDVNGIITVLGRLFFRDIAATGGLLAQLAVLSLVCLVFNNLSAAFGDGNVSGLAQGVTYLLLAGIAVSSFSMAAEQARSAVTGAGDFLYASLPVLMTILASMGGVGSVAFVHPAMLAAVSLVMSILNTVIFPLIYFSAVLSLVNHISSRFSVNKLAKLFKDVSLGVLSIVTTLFLAFLSISGFAGASVDGLAIKAAKTATGIFIPVVGKSLADSLDTVVGISLILKNGIGLLGVIIIIFVCLLPALKILAAALVYRLAGALVQPLGDEMLSDALNGLGSSLQLLFAVVAISGLFFFFLLAITVGMGNITMMMR